MTKRLKTIIWQLKMTPYFHKTKYGVRWNLKKQPKNKNA